MLGRANNNFYKVDFNSEKIEVFATEIDLQLQLFEYSCLQVLSNNTLCVGSRKNGLYIIDENGKLLHNLTLRTGNLNSNNILDLFVDKANNLWVGQSSGVSRIEIPSAFSYLHKNSGIRGGVNSIASYKNALYVATEFGVLQLTDSHIRNIFPTFKLSNILFCANNELLLGAEDGLFLLSNYRNPRKISNDAIVAIAYSPKTQLFFAASKNTIHIYRYENSRLKLWKNIGNFESEINSLAIDSASNLWIGSNANGVFRFQNSDNFQKIEHFINSHGLQKNYPWIQVYESSLGVLYSCADGLYRYNHSAQEFYKDTLIPIPNKLESYPIAPIVEDSKKNLWLSLNSPLMQHSQLAIARFENDSYVFNNKYLNKIDAFWSSTIFPDSNSILWFGGSEGLLRLDFKQLDVKENTNKPLFLNIVLNNDSILAPSYFNSENELHIDHQYNSIRFDFVSPIFEIHEQVTYSYILDGFSETWSEPESETSHSFLNLPAGDYTFRVKSIDVFGNESPENAISFTIKSPHLQQWWTFLIYAILLLPIYFLLSRLFKLLRKFFTKNSSNKTKNCKKIIQKPHKLLKIFYQNKQLKN